ncbi:hypothetical protein Angca_000399, partial [Angiostrongylus cantonensis]
MLGSAVMLDYIKQVTITGDVCHVGGQDAILRRWASEVAKEISEQKPEFAAVHVQGLLSAADPEFVAEVIHGGIIDSPDIYKHFQSSTAFFDTKVTGLGNLYLFREAAAVQHFDRYLNSGYRQMTASHQLCVGERECQGFYQNTFGQQLTFRKEFY